MKTKISPYLHFNDGKCKEAMNFYKKCIGGDLTLDTMGDSPMAKEIPADKHGYIMHAALRKDDLELFGSDMVRDKAVVGDNVSLTLNCESETGMRDIFAKLSEGGDVFMPIEKAFWGGLFGMVTDKYGVEWMLNFQEGEME